MSNNIAQIYSNFLEFEKSRSKTKSASSGAAASSKGFMAPKGKASTTNSGKYAQLERVAEIVAEIRKSRNS